MWTVSGKIGLIGGHARIAVAKGTGFVTLRAMRKVMASHVWALSHGSQRNVPENAHHCYTSASGNHGVIGLESARRPVGMETLRTASIHVFLQTEPKNHPFSLQKILN